MARLLPGVGWRPVSYRIAAGAWAHNPFGWILHVPVMNGSLFNLFENAPSNSRRFCHAWVPKDSSVRPEQYQDLDMKSWAQVAGNGDYWSFEVEGFPNEPMTDHQINVLASWHNFLGTADAVVNTPGGHGIGTHSMGGAGYGGHACPGAIRAAQRPAIITRAQTLRVGGIMATLDADDIKAIGDVTVARILGYPLPGLHEKDANGVTIPINVQTVLTRTYGASQSTLDLTVLAKEIVKALPPSSTGITIDPATLAAAVADLLAARLKA